MSLALLFGTFGCALLLEAWRSHRYLRRNMAPSITTEPPERYPSVTVIRPVRGIDAGARQNLRAALDTGYPGEIETLFVVDDPTEEALPLIREAIEEAEASGRDPNARVLMSGRPPRGRTGKLNAMIVGLEQASGEVIAFADSDIRPDRRALTVLVETLLGNPRAGSAFAPVIVSEPARTSGDAGYGLLLSGLYGPAAGAAARKNAGSLPFIMGQFMVMRREAIAAIGGLQCAEGQLVDDMFLGMRMSQAGFRNMVSPHPVPVIQYDLPIGEFAKTYLRWLIFSRSGLPGRDFKMTSYVRGAVFWLGLVLAIVAFSQGMLLAAALNAAAAVAMVASINRLHQAYGSAPLPLRFSWVALGLLLAAPAILALTYTLRGVTWRGRHYALNAGAQLAARPPPPPRVHSSAELEAAPVSSRGHF